MGLRAKLPSVPWFAAIVLAVIILATILAPILTPYSPEELHLPQRFQPPAWEDGGSTEFFLGTDTVGRDLLTRIFYGARVSLLVAAIVLAIGGIFGLAMGIIAGYVGGIVSTVIMRVVDSLIALPSILIAIVFAMALQPGMRTVIVAISIVLWARFARVIRGEVIGIANSAYILQAKVAGTSQVKIMLVHIIPNVFNTFMILLSLHIGWVILIEASLSFLGAGIPPPTPSWGQMVAEGRGYVTSAWWISFFPGLALALTVLAANLFGDWLRDRLDPKLRQL
ncbi:ABC transporter permease [Chloroflexota bacterium]